jgi:hypothetical protein
MNRKQELKEQLKDVALAHQTLQHEYDEFDSLEMYGWLIAGAIFAFATLTSVLLIIVVVMG